MKTQAYLDATGFSFRANRYRLSIKVNLTYSQNDSSEKVKQHISLSVENVKQLQRLNSFLCYSHIWAIYKVGAEE